MMNKLCNWTKTGRGQMIVAVAATVGGLHLLATPPQKVLGILPAFSMDVAGREVGAQQIVGAVVTVSGLCLLGACCLPMAY